MAEFVRADVEVYAIDLVWLVETPVDRGLNVRPCSDRVGHRLQLAVSAGGGATRPLASRGRVESVLSVMICSFIGGSSASRAVSNAAPSRAKRRVTTFNIYVEYLRLTRAIVRVQKRSNPKPARRPRADGERNRLRLIDGETRLCPSWRSRQPGADRTRCEGQHRHALPSLSDTRRADLSVYQLEIISLNNAADQL